MHFTVKKGDIKNYAKSTLDGNPDISGTKTQIENLASTFDAYILELHNAGVTSSYSKKCRILRVYSGGESKMAAKTHFRLWQPHFRESVRGVMR